MKSRSPTHPAPSEGTIQFHYTLAPPGPGESISLDAFATMAQWRDTLRHLELLGQDSRRYDGYAYGNLSVRDARAPQRFFVTASQTSNAARVTHHQFVRIDQVDFAAFAVVATGAAPPSSESITHAMIYAADVDVDWVMHVHSPDIWNAATRMRLPVTERGVAYGSPAMATAVAGLMGQYHDRPLLFATLGHTDGIFACGADAAGVGTLLTDALRMAREAQAS